MSWGATLRSSVQLPLVPNGQDDNFVAGGPEAVLGNISMASPEDHELPALRVDGAADERMRAEDPKPFQDQGDRLHGGIRVGVPQEFGEPLQVLDG